MNASSPPRPPRRRPAQASRWKPARRLVTSLLVGSLSLLLIGGCSDDANGSAAPTSTPSAMPSPTARTIDEQAALLAQYRKFWASLTSISQLPARERPSRLGELAVDPALKSLLAGMAAADAKGQVFYGAALPDPTVRINPDSTTALIRDCQDGRSAGLANRATGDRITVGVARNHVSVTMKRQPGGIWKVAFVDYPKSAC